MRASESYVLGNCALANHLYSDCPANTSPEADAGTLYHADARKHVETGEQYRGDDVDRSVVNAGIASIWREVSKWFPQPQCEVAFEAGGNTGTCDLADIGTSAGGDDYLAVLDWKTGRIEDEAATFWQCRFYAGLIAYDMPPGTDPAMPVYLFAAFPRSGEYVCQTVTFRDIDRFWGNVIEKMMDDVKSGDRTATTGPHCSHCRAAAVCPAIRKSLIPFSDAGEITVETMIGKLTVMEPSAFTATIRNLKLAKRLLTNAEVAARAVLQAEGGSKGDVELKQVEKALPLLVDNLGPVLNELMIDFSAIWKLATVSKGAVEKIVRETAAPRQGATRVRELIASLEKHGALHKRVEQHLKLKSEKGESDE